MVNDLFGIDMAKVMMGQHAFQIAMNLLMQSNGDGETASGVFQTRHGAPLYAGSKRSHVLLLGDMIFRPRIILATDALQGQGIGHLYTHGFLSEQWMDADRILVPETETPPTPKVSHEGNNRKRRTGHPTPAERTKAVDKR